MPRPAKGPRLWFRSGKRAKAGKPAEPGVWVILDGTGYHRTGCGKGDRKGAERALADHITRKHEVPRRQHRLAEILIADVLNLYLQDRVPHLRTAIKASARIERLLDWWGEMMLDEVTGAACRQFTASRTAGAARRELQDLQAAIGHHHDEGLHREIVRVALPPAGDPRERWLTRSEAARLLWTCLRTRETQGGAETDRHPLRHLARFVLFALYTGSRPSDVLNASFFASSERSVIDLDGGLFFRKPTAKAATNKAQPTIPLPARLLPHLKRWRAMGAQFAVEHHGEPVLSVKVGFARAAALAGLGEDVVPYTLRHTAATWMLQAGVPTWEVAGFLGTSEAMVRKHYGHQSPLHLKQAAGSFSAKKPPRNTVNETRRSATIRIEKR